MNINSAVCAWVDQLVLEQGRYIPVELLLRRGDLSYGDYEHWRAGLGGVLEAHIEGERTSIRETLFQAAAYATSLGLSPRSEQYTSAGVEHPAQPLRFSTDPQRDALYRTLYERNPDSPQLDLFLDSNDTVHEHEVVNALASGKDVDTVEACLERWARALPASTRLDEYRQLLALQHRAVDERSETEAALHMLRDRLAPLAERLLGRHARELLAPHWRRLTQRLAGRAFDAERPLLHASYACTQVLDWAGARSAIEREPLWQGQPVLLARHALVCERLRDRRAMFTSWYRLYWEHPDAATKLMTGNTAPTLQLGLYWQAFQGLEQELPVSDFPAYLVLSHAEFAPYAPAAREPSPTAAEATFGHALALALARNAPLDPGVLQHRKALRSSDPALFDYYLQVTAA
jgi:hypothetical protein